MYQELFKLIRSESKFEGVYKYADILAEKSAPKSSDGGGKVLGERAGRVGDVAEAWMFSITYIR